MNEVFELVKVEREQVIIKVNAEDNLTIAMHPYISKEYDYINVTRGEDHILTIIFKDGHTFNFSWGRSGYTLVSDSLISLRNNVIRFIEDQGVLIDMLGDDIVAASVFYNRNFGKWQLNVNNKANYYSDTAECEDDMFEEAKKFGINASDWIHGIAKTGIDIWNAVL